MADFATELERRSAALGLALPDGAAGRLSTLRDLLQQWNSSAGLVADASDAELLDNHFTDALAHARAIGAVAPGTSLVDVGSGGGLPGLVLRIVAPELSLLLVESQGRKAAFLAEAARVLQLDRVAVAAERVETLGRDAAHREQFGLATARAVAELSVALEYCLPLLQVGGRAILAKGAKLEEELAAAAGVAELLGGAAPEVVIVADGDRRRRFVVVRKVAPSPPRYPRRPGLARKRPLRPGDPMAER